MFQEQLKKPQEKPSQGQQKVSSQQPFKWNHYQARYDEKRKMQHHTHQRPTEIQIPLGTVKIQNLNEPVPSGWRKLTLSEGKQYKDQLNNLLDHWSIVAFETGSMGGHGYNNEIRQVCGEQCGQVFILYSK